MRISDWSSDVCSSDLLRHLAISRADRRRVVILIGDDFYYRGAADRCRKSLRRPILRQSGAGIGVGVAIVDALVDRLHALQRPETRPIGRRSEEHTSELQSLMRSSSAVFCSKTKAHRDKLLTISQQKTQN